MANWFVYYSETSGSETWEIHSSHKAVRYFAGVSLLLIASTCRTELLIVFPRLILSRSLCKPNGTSLKFNSLMFTFCPLSYVAKMKRFLAGSPIADSTET